MTTYGVTPQGFVAKPIDVIKSELEDSFRATFGPGINLEPQSNFGQIIGIFSDRLSSMWDLGEAVYASMTPDGAAGLQLDDLASITGSVRLPPSLTHVHVTLTGTVGTLIAAGQIIAVAGTGVQFKTVNDVTIPGGGTISNVEAVAVSPGANPAYAGTLTTIVTPVAGWTSVTNPADHYILGTDLESDALFRLRRLAELRVAGAASAGAIQGRLLALPGVLQAVVYADDFNHQIECLVDGGVTFDIGNVIYDTKSAGIGTTGTTFTTVTDNTGAPLTIAFSRPSDVDIYIIVNVTVVHPSGFPADGVLQIQNALLNYAAGYQFGASVVASTLSAQAFKVAGVLDVTSVKIGTSASPTLSTTITTTDHEIPRFAIARIAVNVT